MTEETKEVKGLGNIVDEMASLQKKASEGWEGFSSNFQKFTGFSPNEPMNAFKVLQMIGNIESHKVDEND